MEKLSLPAFPHTLQQRQGKAYILDRTRGKYVRLTPEEWVRQHLLYYLIHQLGYPKGLLRLELPLRYARLAKRVDIACFAVGQSNPLMLVECKAASQPLRQPALDQLALYNAVAKAPYLLLSNGKQHLCFATAVASSPVLLAGIPTFAQLQAAVASCHH